MRTDEDWQPLDPALHFIKPDLHARPDETLCVSHGPPTSCHSDHRQFICQYLATMPLVDSKVAAETPKEVFSGKIIIFCAVLSFSGALHGTKLRLQLLFPWGRQERLSTSVKRVKLDRHLASWLGKVTQPCQDIVHLQGRNLANRCSSQASTLPTYLGSSPCRPFRRNSVSTQWTAALSLTGRGGSPPC